MKTYEQMLDFIIADLTTGRKDLRYVGWAVCMVIGEVYGIDPQVVSSDTAARLNAVLRAQTAAWHEERRQANLAAKGEQ